MAARSPDTEERAWKRRVVLCEQLEQADRRAATTEARAERADEAFAAEGELRGRVDELASKLANAQAELATAQDQAEAASARAIAAVEAQQALMQADAVRRSRPLWQRLKAAWLAE